MTASTVWQLDLDCPRCGGPLERVNGAEHGGTVTLAIAQCPTCLEQKRQAQWELRCTLTPHKRRPDR